MFTIAFETFSDAETGALPTSLHCCEHQLLIMGRECVCLSAEVLCESVCKAAVTVGKAVFGLNRYH